MAENNITQRWMANYHLAEAYYKKYGDLEMSYGYKTKNGVDYDKDGVCLGHWIFTQRRAKNGKGTALINNEQISLLEKIGMRFENINKQEEWMKKYRLAKAYYEFYGDLRIPYSFKTKNGIDYDEDGFCLGSWIQIQKCAYRGLGNNKISKEQITYLESIGIRWEFLADLDWMRNFTLAKNYYQFYGNLEIPQKFKTINGYEYDEKGISLGTWIHAQRHAKRDGRKRILTNEQILLLDSIGMRWDYLTEMEWLKYYKLAINYYEHYGNLKIYKDFYTKNGFEYDREGAHLGGWILSQRAAKKGKSTNRITEEQVSLLNEIGMIWNVNKNIEELEEICLQNTIPMNINKKNLSGMSSFMLQAKISLLKENGISLVDENGKLHEIFSLSHQNIQEKYSINMKDFLKKPSSLNKMKEIRNG